MERTTARRPHDGEMAYCEQCGWRIELYDVEITVAGEFECPNCGRPQHVSEQE